VGIKVVERLVRRQEILEADELFTSSTSRRVMPASRIEDRVLQEAPGPVSRKLLTLMDAVCSGREERFNHWLHPIQ
jgi:branched-subunit amino acid aminotransferase/4-amino-4-deoxychorismate lyase